MSDEPARTVKCVVWDLDNTIWEGTLLEGGGRQLRDGVAETIRTLDRRGVLQSVASKNDHASAIDRLTEFGLIDYFLIPQVSWESKSAAVGRISAGLNIGLDTVLFVDDDPFERAEVEAAIPVVRCVDSADVAGVLKNPGIPAAGEVTADAALRRSRYRQEAGRREHESGFGGTKVEFLRSLRLRLRIRPADPEDLNRAAELIERTNQLNTTGVVYDHSELLRLLPDERYVVLVLSLDDIFGDYGQIGVVLAHRDESIGELRLLLFLLSCRVMGRNLVPPIIAALASAADSARLRLTADFRETEVNRPMYLAYRMAGFTVLSEANELKTLQLSDTAGRQVADHVEITMPEFLSAGQSGPGSSAASAVS